MEDLTTKQLSVRFLSVSMFVMYCIIVLLFAASGLAQSSTLSATLAWSNPDTVNGIQIEKASSLAGAYATLQRVAPGTVSYLDATNSPNTVACYRVAYFNASGVGTYAGPVCKTFQAIPGQVPLSLTIQ